MKQVFSVLWQLLVSAIGWCVIAPIAYLIPKRPDWVAVIGRQDGRFLDNAKYFFLQAPNIAPDLRIVFVTQLAEEYRLVTGRSREALLYPTAKSVWFLMRCGTVIVDEAAWFRQARFFLLIRSQVVQFWHGVPFKWIELGLWRHETGRFAWASRPWALWLRLLTYRLTGRRMRYAAVVSPSTFYRDKVFSQFFVGRHFPIAGYARNDFALSLENENLELAWDNVDTEIKARLVEWQQLDRKLVLIAPTFRDSGVLPMRLDSCTLPMLDDFAEESGVEFIFKFHPSERNADHIAGRHFHVCARDSDIYPLLPHVSALVTDYSSISIDFLFVDKPLLFFIPDNDDYIGKDRQLQFDPRVMMPGPVVSSWTSLLSSLLAEWKHDGCVEERAVLRRQAFDGLPQSQAVPKLIAFMREQRWLPANDD